MALMRLDNLVDIAHVLNFNKLPVLMMQVLEKYNKFLF